MLLDGNRSILRVNRDGGGLSDDGFAFLTTFQYTPVPRISTQQRLFQLNNDTAFLGNEPHWIRREKQKEGSSGQGIDD